MKKSRLRHQKYCIWGFPPVKEAETLCQTLALGAVQISKPACLARSQKSLSSHMRKNRSSRRADRIDHRPVHEESAAADIVGFLHLFKRAVVDLTGCIRNELGGGRIPPAAQMIEAGFVMIAKNLGAKDLAGRLLFRGAHETCHQIGCHDRVIIEEQDPFGKIDVLAQWRATLLPPAKPRFFFVSMMGMSGYADRISATEPSVEPLSTTTVEKRGALSALASDERHSSVSSSAAVPELTPAEKKRAEGAQGSELAALLRLEDLTLEIGFQLIPLVDEKQGGQLLGRVRLLRRHLSSEMGFLVPPVHISDNLRLKPREYMVSLRGIEIGRWQTEGPHLLAVSGEAGRRPLAGKETREPAFGVPAIWIAPALEEQAIAAGYSVVDAVTVITTHLGELIRQHAWELLGRAEIKRLLDALNDSHPKLLEELVPKLLTLGEVGRVLEQLLRERVSIRDLGTILEALLETATVNKSLVALVEAARQALGRRLVRPLLDGDGQLPVLLVDPALEEEILATVSPETGQLATGQRLLTAAPPGAPLVRRLTDSVRSLIGSASSSAPPVLLCPSPARYHVRRWLEPVLPRLAVVAASEVPPEIRLRPVGTVR